jgi:hypothetical protein
MGVALAGKGVLAIWNGIAEEAEADFVAWHMREHIPERVAVPGFLRGRRYVAISGTPKYFNFYETESPETLNAPAYIERLNAPSEWTRRVVRHFRDTSRTICAVAASVGQGDGAYICTLRLTARAERATLADRLAITVMAPLLAAPSIVSAHLLEGQPESSGGQTAEKSLRDQPDQTAEWILLIEATDPEPLQAVLAGVASPEALQAAGATCAAPEDCGIYRLQYALSRAQVL